MKKLLIILIALVAMSCEKSWYKQGHIDPGNTCEFIVNDSISVVGKVIDNGTDVMYNVFVNGEEVELTSVYNSTRYSTRDAVNTMEKRYKEMGNAQCFKFQQ